MIIEDTHEYTADDGSRIVEHRVSGSRFSHIAVKHDDEAGRVSVRAKEVGGDIVAKCSFEAQQTRARVVTTEGVCRRRDVDDDIQDLMTTMGFAITDRRLLEADAAGAAGAAADESSSAPSEPSAPASERTTSTVEDAASTSGESGSNPEPATRDGERATSRTATSGSGTPPAGSEQAVADAADAVGDDDDTDSGGADDSAAAPEATDPGQEGPPADEPISLDDEIPNVDDEADVDEPAGDVTGDFQEAMEEVGDTGDGSVSAPSRDAADPATDPSPSVDLDISIEEELHPPEEPGDADETAPEESADETDEAAPEDDRSADAAEDSDDGFSIDGGGTDVDDAWPPEESVAEAGAATGESEGDAGADETGADETGADEIGADETGADEIGADETGADETGAGDCRVPLDDAMVAATADAARAQSSSGIDADDDESADSAEDPTIADGGAATTPTEQSPDGVDHGDDDVAESRRSRRMFRRSIRSRRGEDDPLGADEGDRRDEDDTTAQDGDEGGA